MQKNWITLNAVIALVFGIAFTMYAPLMANFFQIPESGSQDIVLYWNAMSFARLFGAALFAWGILLFALRSAMSELSPETRYGVIFALVLGNALGAITAVTQIFSVWQNAAGWITLGIFVLLTAGYGYLLVRGSAQRQEA